MALVTDRKRCMWIEAISNYPSSLVRTKARGSDVFGALASEGPGGTLTPGGT